MRKKSNTSELVTKGFLRLELEEKLGELKEELDENARKYRDQLLTKLDGVMGELQEMREDNIIGTHQTSELRDRVDDHEVRITALEK